MWAPLSTRLLRPIIRWRMRRCGLSESGFLACWESLPRVIRRDRVTLAELGITAGQIADALELLLERADVLINRALEPRYRAGGRERVRFRESTYSWPSSFPRFAVNVLPSCGWQDCPFVAFPWRPCPAAGTRDVIVRSADGGRIRFGDLSIHLIREHSFFEGNVPYRVDPAECVRVLGLKPGVSYAPVWLTVPFWDLRMDGVAMDELPDDEYRRDLHAVIEGADEHVEPIPGANLYVKRDECAAVYERESGEFEITVDGHELRDAFSRPVTRLFCKAARREVSMDRPEWGAVSLGTGGFKGQRKTEE